ncbi:helix-turn-helix domain-containing protein [Cryptosporangium sp. NPDC051539]|uniref:helix-turn-helix domain-containing protein n=1 Tax=Cryptosporangium sp. NPDC051539 TaxID=3363962 RepID=UPI0037A95748
MADAQRLWTHRETAAFLRVTPETLYLWVAKTSIDDPLPSMRIGRFHRYDPDAVKAWVGRRQGMQS